MHLNKFSLVQCRIIRLPHETVIRYKLSIIYLFYEIDCLLSDQNIFSVLELRFEEGR